MGKLIGIPIAFMLLVLGLWHLSKDKGDGSADWTKAKAVWVRELVKVILLGILIVTFSSVPLLFILVMFELGRGR